MAIELQFESLEKSDLDQILSTDEIRTIWQLNPLIDVEVANLASMNHIEQVLSKNQSYGVQRDGDLSAFIIGSLPEWDRDFFGFDSYLTRYYWSDSEESLKFLLDAFEKMLKEHGVRYAYTRIPVNDKLTVRQFEKHGFGLADLRVTFNRLLMDELQFPTNLGILNFELANEDDIEAMAELSKSVSKINRFHSDPLYSSERSSELYYEWVANGAAAGKDSIKCTINGELAGFHMSYPEKSLAVDGTPLLAVTDIFGVYPKYRGRGIGNGLNMNFFALAKSRGQKSVTAGVHVNNISSMRLHESLGFQVFHAEIGLRKWYP